MSNIWTDQNRYGRWLEVGILACEKMELLHIPKADVQKIRLKCKGKCQRDNKLNKKRAMML